MIRKLLTAIRTAADWFAPFREPEPNKLGPSGVDSQSAEGKAYALWQAAQDRSRRIWLIDNRRESLAKQIAAARKAHRPRKHLQAEMERLTTEKLRLEQ